MLNWFKKTNKVYSADVAGTATVIEVKRRQTLLNAALQSGLNWPHRCKVGSCGTCRCVLAYGKIKPQIDFGYVLSPEQIKEGYILACQTELASDISVKLNQEISL